MAHQWEAALRTPKNNIIAMHLWAGISHRRTQRYSRPPCAYEYYSIRYLTNCLGHSTPSYFDLLFLTCHKFDTSPRAVSYGHIVALVSSLRGDNLLSHGWRQSHRPLLYGLVILPYLPSISFSRGVLKRPYRRSGPRLLLTTTA